MANERNVQSEGPTRELHSAVMSVSIHRVEAGLTEARRNLA